MSNYDLLKNNENKNFCAENLNYAKVDDASLSEISGGQASFKKCPRCGCLIVYNGDNDHNRVCRGKK